MYSVSMYHKWQVRYFHHYQETCMLKMLDPNNNETQILIKTDV